MVEAIVVANDVAEWQRGLNAEVVFGCPGKHCEGLGVCMIVGFGQARSGDCFGAPAGIGLNKAARWEIVLEKQGVNPVLVQKHLSGGQFRVEEAFRLPVFVLKHFQEAHVPEWIMPGTYPVIETPGYYLICF